MDYYVLCVGLELKGLKLCSLLGAILWNEAPLYHYKKWLFKFIKSF